MQGDEAKILLSFSTFILDTLERPTEFWRSESAIDSRELVISVKEPPRKSMDEISSEEFQLSTESFIAERKKVLVQENSAHYKRRQVKSMRTVLYCIGFLGF
ncbi:hypothetical protein V6N13_064782 [Hibiscus sabdariffa]|uniref:Uncharacterized protein n=1 Tax=Hibiscus sabdariffa TaxID=183260 RepID=A0ABR2EEN9_9ROSI